MVAIFFYFSFKTPCKGFACLQNKFLIFYLIPSQISPKRTKICLGNYIHFVSKMPHIALSMGVKVWAYILLNCCPHWIFNSYLRWEQVKKPLFRFLFYLSLHFFLKKLLFMYFFFFFCFVYGGQRNVDSL